jgi:hypothetical protein
MIFRGKTLQGQPRATRWITLLDHSAEDLISENDHDNDDNHGVTLILGSVFLPLPRTKSYSLVCY